MLETTPKRQEEAIPKKAKGKIAEKSRSHLSKAARGGFDACGIHIPKEALLVVFMTHSLESMELKPLLSRMTNRR